jgi:hypothetical protein
MGNNTKAGTGVCLVTLPSEDGSERGERGYRSELQLGRLGAFAWLEAWKVLALDRLAAGWAHLCFALPYHL